MDGMGSRGQSQQAALDMKRINVIGTTGSGKSTFARLLADKLGYPCIHMDQLYWKPDWVESGNEEFFTKVESAVSGECWVLDGNYSKTNQIKWQRADTIVWLDYSYFRTFLQLLRRTINRAVKNEELWPGTGNRESFRKSFMSRDSILLWFFLTYKKNKTGYAALQELPLYNHIQFVRLRSPRDVTTFLESITADLSWK